MNFIGKNWVAILFFIIIIVAAILLIRDNRRGVDSISGLDDSPIEEAVFQKTGE